MIEINDKLDEKLRQQMDGRLEEDEELQLRSVAKAYAMCENSIAVLSNLRTNKSHIYYGKTSADRNVKYIPTRHRIFYYKGNGQRGVCYAICLFNIATKTNKLAIMKNSLTGEERQIDIDEKQLLSEREITIMNMVSEGLQSKAISTRLEISKNTVDRHRQNIISKMQASNMAEACHKAKQLGLL